MVSLKIDCDLNILLSKLMYEMLKPEKAVRLPFPKILLLWHHLWLLSNSPFIVLKSGMFFTELETIKT